MVQKWTLKHAFCHLSFTEVGKHLIRAASSVAEKAEKSKLKSDTMERLISDLEKWVTDAIVTEDRLAAVGSCMAEALKAAQSDGASDGFVKRAMEFANYLTQWMVKAAVLACGAIASRWEDIQVEDALQVPKVKEFYDSVVLLKSVSQSIQRWSKEMCKLIPDTKTQTTAGLQVCARW